MTHRPGEGHIDVDLAMERSEKKGGEFLRVLRKKESMSSSLTTCQKKGKRLKEKKGQGSRFAVFQTEVHGLFSQRPKKVTSSG